MNRGVGDNTTRAKKSERIALRIAVRLIFGDVIFIFGKVRFIFGAVRFYFAVVRF